jgi:hypothetical protein
MLVRAMGLMIVLSLLINVAVLVPVCAGLLSNASWTTSAYGEATPARAIRRRGPGPAPRILGGFHARWSRLGRWRGLSMTGR